MEGVSDVATKKPFSPEKRMQHIAIAPRQENQELEEVCSVPVGARNTPGKQKIFTHEDTSTRCQGKLSDFEQRLHSFSTSVKTPPIVCSCSRNPTVVLLVG